MKKEKGAGRQGEIRSGERLYGIALFMDLPAGQVQRPARDVHLDPVGAGRGFFRRHLVQESRGSGREPARGQERPGDKQRDRGAHAASTLRPFQVSSCSLTSTSLRTGMARDMVSRSPAPREARWES